MPWSQAMLATKPIREICKESGGKYCALELEAISVEVKNAAQKIIKAKNSTYYGIGMALVRITKAIFGNENSVLTVSTMLNGEYGMNEVYAGVPAIVNREGVREILVLPLEEEERKKLGDSCALLNGFYKDLRLS